MIYERHCSKLWRRARSATPGHTIQQEDVPLGHNLLLSGHFLTASVHFFEVLRTFFVIVAVKTSPMLWCKCVQ